MAVWPFPSRNPTLARANVALRDRERNWTEHKHTLSEVNANFPNSSKVCCEKTVVKVPVNNLAMSGEVEDMTRISNFSCHSAEETFRQRELRMGLGILQILH